MYRILAITSKDLLQLVRDGKIYLFLLVMPIAFTVLFGYAFGSFGSDDADPRLPVVVVDLDQSEYSQQLLSALDSSRLMRTEPASGNELPDLEKQLQDGDYAAIIIIPTGYEDEFLGGNPGQITLLANPASTTTNSLQTEILVASRRLASALWTAQTINEFTNADQGWKGVSDPVFQQALGAWESPPIQFETSAGETTEAEEPPSFGSSAHSSPGMMLQFAIAGLLTAATVIVVERKTNALERLLTTPARRFHILIGHFLAIFIIIFLQFIILIAFGQILLKVDYMSDPLATFLVALSAALCISALGLLIGVLAKNEGQAIIFSLIPMFILSGLGGAWVPLEVTGETFQLIGHFSPVAWAMDGFKNITVRSLGVEAAVVPTLALLGYALLFLVIAALIFNRVER